MLWQQSQVRTRLARGGPSGHAPVERDRVARVAMQNSKWIAQALVGEVTADDSAGCGRHQRARSRREVRQVHRPHCAGCLGRRQDEPQVGVGGEHCNARRSRDHGAAWARIGENRRELEWRQGRADRNSDRGQGREGVKRGDELGPGRQHHQHGISLAHAELAECAAQPLRKSEQLTVGQHDVLARQLDRHALGRRGDARQEVLDKPR